MSSILFDTLLHKEQNTANSHSHSESDQQGSDSDSAGSTSLRVQLNQTSHQRRHHPDHEADATHPGGDHSHNAIQQYTAYNPHLLIPGTRRFRRHLNSTLSESEISASDESDLDAPIIRFDNWKSTFIQVGDAFFESPNKIMTQNGNVVQSSASGNTMRRLKKAALADLAQRRLVRLCRNRAAAARLGGGHATLQQARNRQQNGNKDSVASTHVPGLFAAAGGAEAYNDSCSEEDEDFKQQEPSRAGEHIKQQKESNDSVVPPTASTDSEPRAGLDSKQQSAAPQPTTRSTFHEKSSASTSTLQSGAQSTTDCGEDSARESPVLTASLTQTQTSLIPSIQNKTSIAAQVSPIIPTADAAPVPVLGQEIAAALFAALPRDAKPILRRMHDFTFVESLETLLQLYKSGEFTPQQCYEHRHDYKEFEVLKPITLDESSAAAPVPTAAALGLPVNADASQPIGMLLLVFDESFKRFLAHAILSFHQLTSDSFNGPTANTLRITRVNRKAGYIPHTASLQQYVAETFLHPK